MNVRVAALVQLVFARGTAPLLPLQIRQDLCNGWLLGMMKDSLLAGLGLVTRFPTCQENFDKIGGCAGLS